MAANPANHRPSRHSRPGGPDRVYAAIINSGQAWPAWTITIDLLPASLPRHGTGFSLAIDVAAVTAAGTVSVAALDG